jgi:hypothetical protein
MRISERRDNNDIQESDLKAEEGFSRYGGDGVAGHVSDGSQYG